MKPTVQNFPSSIKSNSGLLELFLSVKYKLHYHLIKESLNVETFRMENYKMNTHTQAGHNALSPRHRAVYFLMPRASRDHLHLQHPEAGTQHPPVWPQRNTHRGPTQSQKQASSQQPGKVGKLGLGVSFHTVYSNP